jgi:hypothetical protein
MASPPQRLCRDLRSTTTAISRSRDVIVEILSWLPAKPLCQFRCVSREWHALISSRAFAAMHRSRAEPLLVGMSTSVSGTTNLQLMDTDGAVVRSFPAREGNWTLWATLDDLACISFSSGRSSTLLVVDLSTGKALLLAEDAAAGFSGFLMYASCGRASRTGSLKVFRLDAHLTCEVLGLGDGARWRQVQSPPHQWSPIGIRSPPAP